MWHEILCSPIGSNQVGWSFNEWKQNKLSTQLLSGCSHMSSAQGHHMATSCHDGQCRFWRISFSTEALWSNFYLYKCLRKSRVNCGRHFAWVAQLSQNPLQTAFPWQNKMPLNEAFSDWLLVPEIRPGPFYISLWNSSASLLRNFNQPKHFGKACAKVCCSSLSSWTLTLQDKVSMLRLSWCLFSRLMYLSFGILEFSL